MPVLDRRVHFDPASRAFSAAAPIEAMPPRSHSWYLGQLTLDQGEEGECVAFACAQEAAARPAVRPQTNADARRLFQAVQAIDRERHGLHFDEGATVLAGMKAGVDAGWWVGYEWAFGLDDLVLGVGYRGPHVLGLNWYDGMWRPDADGFLHPTGRRRGGHAIVCLAVDVAREAFLLANSWGPSWSLVPWRKTFVTGHALVSFEAMDRLLREDGEAALPIGRTRAPKAVR